MDATQRGQEFWLPPMGQHAPGGSEGPWAGRAPEQTWAGEYTEEQLWREVHAWSYGRPRWGVLDSRAAQMLTHIVLACTLVMITAVVTWPAVSSPFARVRLLAEDLNPAFPSGDSGERTDQGYPLASYTVLGELGDNLLKAHPKVPEKEVERVLVGTWKDQRIAALLRKTPADVTTTTFQTRMDAVLHQDVAAQNKELAKGWIPWTLPQQDALTRALRGTAHGMAYLDRLLALTILLAAAALLLTPDARGTLRKLAGPPAALSALALATLTGMHWAAAGATAGSSTWVRGQWVEVIGPRVHGPLLLTFLVAAPLLAASAWVPRERLLRSLGLLGPEDPARAHEPQKFTGLDQDLLPPPPAPTW